MIPQNGKSFDDLIIGFHENALKKFAKNSSHLITRFILHVILIDLFLLKK